MILHDRAMKRLLLLLVVVVSSGCVEGGDPHVEITIDASQIVDDGGFELTGDVEAYSRQTTDSFTYSNVSLVLYRKDHTIIKREELGSITTLPDGEAVNVSIESSKVPFFIVVESPDFWTGEVPVQIKGLRRVDSTYREYWITDRNEIPTER